MNMSKRPPKFFDRLLQWYCIQTDLEDIQGDLYEVYYDRMEDSQIKAKWLFAMDTLRLFYPFSTQRKRSTWLRESYHFNFRNQARVAYRNLKKYPFVNSLKILGLSVAISAFFFIADYVRFHHNFDQFHENKERIYRIVTTVTSPDLQDVTAWSHAYVRDIADELAGVEHVVRLLKVEEAVIVDTDEEQFKESEVFYADPEFAKVFSYEWIEGNPNTALMDPSSVVLTESMAKKYFNTTREIVGKLLTIDKESYRVSGLVKDIPPNSDLKFDFLIPLAYGDLEEWMFVYVLLEENQNVRELEASFTNVITDYNDHYTDQGISLVYDFENITDVHFSEPKLYDTPKMDKQQINLFQLVGWIILIIALVNYINLFTTQLLQRIRNINVQMTVGASKKQLFLEFAMEATIYLGLALIIGIGITCMLRDIFTTYGDFPFFSVPVRSDSVIYLATAFMASVFATALYALIISTRKSNNQLFESKVIKAPLRKVLIGVQFALSFVVILSTLIIYLQTLHLQNQPLGFNPDQAISYQFPDYVEQSTIETIKEEFSQLSFVESTSQIESNAIPGMDAWVEEYYIPELQQTKLFEELGVDDAYDEALELKMIEGEFFTEGKHKPYRAFVINEAFLSHIGWDMEEAIGKKLNVYGHGAPIIGVVQNFYFNSPHELIKPLILGYTPQGSFAITRLSRNTEFITAIDQLEMAWFKHLPNLPFHFSFVKSDYAIQFKKEQATINVLSLVAGLVITLSLLGMYAILSMLAKAREKELGIRKVNGAQPLDLFKLFSKEFVIILVAAITVASPFIWMVLIRWLEKYPIRITLNPIYFIGIAITVIISASMIVYFQAFKAYQTNTADSLKHE